MSRNARVLGALLTPVVTVPVAAQAAHAYDPPAPPKNPNLPRELDIASPYLPQTVCDPAAKPGVTAFARLMSQHYSEFSYGISRACNYGLTEHSEGRALDWMLNKNDPTEHAIADAVVDWLVAPDANGQPGAMARRFGIMYIIWDRRIWGTYQMNEGWRPYYGSSPHTDHIHFSFSWDGAMRRTSWWTGKAWTSVTRTPGGSASVPVTPSTPDSYPTLRVGASGSDVALAQKVIGTPADGAFGPATETALRIWQRSNSVTVSGVLDAATWARMVSLGKVPPRGTASGLAQYEKTTIRLGSSGAAVTALQKELKVTADGAFGPQTEAAVRSFQKSKGLTVDGVVSANVWKALAGLSYTKTGTTTTPAKETVYSRYGKQTLRQGSSGAAVTALQKEVKVTADGAFGPQTEAAVRSFQKSKGLTVDGVVSANVWKALAGLSYTKTGTTTTPAKETVYSRYGKQTLRQGSSGAAVTALQKKVKVTADGAFGPQTEAAVRSFQKSKGLTVDGVVSANVWKALAGLSYTKTGTTTTPAKETVYSRYGKQTLRRGSSGAAVTALQKELKVTADGAFGPQTEAAVRSFQKSKGLTVDGVVSANVWKALAGLSYTKTGTTATTPSTGTPFAPYKSTVLATGARGTAVKAVQRALGGLAVDGVYGPATAQAVKAFQTREKLRATGIVDGKTWDALERKQNPLLPYRSSVLKVGSRGAAVTALQRALGITADGVYGSQTQAAVKAFQKRVKLTQTGIVTSVTWDALGRQR